MFSGVRIGFILIVLLGASCRRAPPPDVPNPNRAPSRPSPSPIVAVTARLVLESELSDGIGTFGQHLAFSGSRLAADNGYVLDQQPDRTWQHRQARAFSASSMIGEVALDGEDLIFCRTWPSNRRELLIARPNAPSPRFRFPGRKGDLTCEGVASSEHRIAVGAPGSQPTHTMGAVRIYERVGEDWRATLTIRPPAEVANSDGFGDAVALDGATLAVGAPTAAHTDNLYIYRLEGTPDARTASLVQSFDEPKNGGLLGASVAVHGDWLAAGGYHTVTLYHRHDGEWQEAETLSADAPGEMSTFGSSVALGADVLAVGDAGDGAWYVYHLTTSGWTALAHDRCPESGIWHMGLAIAGDRVAIGCPWRHLDHPGQVRVYRIDR